MLSSTVLGPMVVIIGVEFVVEIVRVVPSGERIVPWSDRSAVRSRVLEAGESSTFPSSKSQTLLSNDLRGPTKAGSGGMMNVVGFCIGTKSIMSLWLLNPSSLARRFCLLRLTKKRIKPMVQARRTQAPETDPAMIGVLAFCLHFHNCPSIGARGWW